MQSRIQQNKFWLLVLGLCGFYLGFEIFFNYYATIGVDEFWFAHNVFAFKNQLPYRDFAPYKTVLGYYLLLAPMLWQNASTITTIIFTKNLLALLNTLIFCGGAMWLRKYFSGKSILTSLAIILTSELVLSYSTNFRVDLLGYWFGFLALILLIDNRYIASGLLMGLGFATTQKVIWYVAASDGALGLYWLLYERDFRTLKNIFAYNLSLLSCIAAYLCFWGAVVSWHVVMNSVFYEASIMYQLDWYSSARFLFWKALTLNNPVLFFLWPLTLVSILITHACDRAYKQRFFIVTFSLIIFACLVPYKQIFPYYLQVAIPVLLLLYAAFFSWLYDIFNHQSELQFLIPKNLICLLLGLDIAGILWFTVIFELPTAYLLSATVPILLANYCINFKKVNSSTRTLMLNMICGTIIIVNGIFPLMLFCIKMVDINGGYQKQNLNIANNLIADGTDYVAGIELVYNKTQPIAGMRHLMGPAIDYLYKPTAKLRAVMLSSLNEDPDATIDTVIEAFKQSKVKLYINNYRMNALPPQIKSFLAEEYEHYWGSIYLYAPKIAEGDTTIQIRFSGHYKIKADARKNIQLDGKSYVTNSAIYLSSGTHVSHSDFDYRLKLLPENILLPNFDQADHWAKMLI